MQFCQGDFLCLLGPVRRVLRILATTPLHDECVLYEKMIKMGAPSTFYDNLCDFLVIVWFF